MKRASCHLRSARNASATWVIQTMKMKMNSNRGYAVLRMLIRRISYARFPAKSHIVHNNVIKIAGRREIRRISCGLRNVMYRSATLVGFANDLLLYYSDLVAAPTTVESDNFKIAPATNHASRRHSRNGTTRWRCLPSLSMPMRISSPALGHTGGFMPSATPAGVPVVTTSPGSSTMNCET